MWKIIARIILRNRIGILISIALITIFMGFKATKVRMDYHFANLLSDTDPAFIDNQKFKEIFGEEANGIIIGIVDSNFFNIQHFNNFEKLCKDLNQVEHVTNVLTINRAINLRQNKGEFQIYNFFPETVKSQEELDSLADKFFSLPFYKGLLYNSSNVYLLAITISKDVLNSAARIPVVKEIEAVVESFSQDNNIEIHISGHPYIRTETMIITKAEVKIFIILALLVCVGFLYFFFRSFKIIGVTLLVVGISVVWAIGLMGILDYKITILTAMVPPLMIVIGIPNAVYLLNRYYAETKKHGNKILGLQRVITKIGAAVCASNFTTAVALAAFITTNNKLLVEFGIISSCGVVFSFLMAIIILPAIYSFLKPPAAKYTRHFDNRIIRIVLYRLSRLALNYRKTIYTVFGIALFISIFGIILIKQTGYIVDEVPQGSIIHKDLKFLEKHFNGAFPLEIAVISKDSLSGYAFIEQIEKLDSLQTRLKKYPELSRSVSVADATKFLYQAYCKGNQPENYKLPPNSLTYENIFKRLPKMDKMPITNGFLDSTRTKTRISLNIEDIGTKRMKELIPKIKNDVEDIFPSDNYTTIVTGSTVLYFIGTTYLTHNLFSSILFAILIIILFMYWVFRSYKVILVSLIPNLIPMIVTAGIMGFLGIPIKPSTILIFSIAFGISVDATIHYLAKYQQELKNYSFNVRIAAKTALKETGLSMVYTYVILLFGFSIFITSSFGGTKALGSLISITLFVAMFSNLVLLPSLLVTFEKFLGKKSVKELEIPIEIYEENEAQEILEETEEKIDNSCNGDDNFFE